MSVPTAAPPTRREEILAIAGGLFAEHGFHGTSIRHIASAATLSSATLYGHFPSKASMFRELADRYFAELFVRLEEIAASDAPGSVRLTEMVRGSIEVGLRHRPAFVALSNNWTAVRTTPVLAELVEQRDKATELWLGVIGDAAREGSIRSDANPSDVLWLVFSSVTGMVDDRYVSIDGSSGQPPVDLLLATLSNGLLVSPLPGSRGSR